MNSAHRISSHLVSSPVIAVVGVLAVAALQIDARAQGTPNLGSWEPAFDHPGGPAGNPPPCANPPVAFPSGPFDAIHASLIPKGPHRGHVMVFNHITYPGAFGSHVGQTRVITYSIVDPSTQQFWDHTVCLVPDQGDLFCAGHAWNSLGDLVLAGGTTKHGNPFGGAKLLYVWEPPTTLGAAGMWLPSTIPLDDYRWYPSLVAMGPDPQTDEDRILVMGGSHPVNNGQFVNSYQCWRPTGGAGSWEQNTMTNTNTFVGPPATADLRDYPRAHFLSNKEIGTAGMRPYTMKVLHYTISPTPPGVWQGPAPLGGVHPGIERVYGSSVLLPISPGGGIKDVLMAVGGKAGSESDPFILNSTEWSKAGASSPAWVQAGSLNQPRWFLNTVLLPDSTVFAVGGEQQFTGFGCSEVPALVPEILVAGQWQARIAGTIARDYHSTALLLPNAKVLTAGGESRHYGAWTNCANQAGRSATVFPADFQLFVPPYINAGNVRPSIQVAAGATLPWGYGTQQSVGYATLPFGVSVARIVLMRAGSVTHHCDPNQRCVELAFNLLPDVDPPTGFSALTVSVPTKASYLLPRGYYMLYLVTNQGTPSEAAWVLIS